MAFAPIAVVGRGCVLPGAHSPAELWEVVASGRCVLAPADRAAWRIGSRADREQLAREIASDVGGYVRGFDPALLDGVDGIDGLRGLDPVFLWTLHAAREALREAGQSCEGGFPRGQVVLGNLSYPTPALVELARDVWGGRPPTVDARNRFMSGLPAGLVARALGFGGGGFALDAACASSLYAIRLACDRLHDRTCDIAVAGGVNHADDLFLHLGFTALAALSPTGRSRPFHRDADGLVPAQGAAVVVLKRLADAEAAGDRVLGVIRGVGLSNDGRSRGLLVPSEDGQVRAMRSAYEISGLAPTDISFVECHATGTSVGDAMEIASLRRVFAGASDVPLGSLKSNLGHLVTASGAAGLIKVLGAMAAGVRPPTLNADQPLPSLSGGPLRLVLAAEPWETRAPRRAAISNFGFGGNNAHLLVEEWTPPRSHAVQVPTSAPVPVDIAVIAQSVIAGAAASTGEFEEALLAGRSSIAGDPPAAASAPFELDVAGLRFPPSDLREALPQQTMLLRATRQLAEEIARLPRDRTALLVGMQCDAEVARCGLRWRDTGMSAGPATDAPLTAALVVGCMPNVVANRVGHQLDLTAPTFTVSAEEASGTVALELAMRSLSTGEIDAALVGAVDLAAEPVARTAASAVLSAANRVPGDAAVLLILKRLVDARRDGDRVMAVLNPTATTTAEHTPGISLRAGGEGDSLAPLFGHAHAASGLLAVAAAVVACERHALPATADHPSVPWLPSEGRREAQVAVSALGDTSTTTFLRAPERGVARPGPSSPRLAVFASSSVDGLVNALHRREPAAPGGDHRVAIIAPGEAELHARIERAASLLRSRGGVAPGELAEGIHFGAGPTDGELAFVFTGPAGAYTDMGRDLALGLPDLVDGLAARSAALREAAGWIYHAPPSYSPTPAEKLWASSYLCQLHAELTRGLLEMKPQASIGYCSGESNALFAFGAWSDLDGFRREIDALGLYTHELCGELRALRRAWQLPDDKEVGWTTVRVRAPVRDVQAAIASEPRVHLTIISGPSDVVIAGDPAACARVAARIGVIKTTPLGYDFVIHCPEAQAFGAEWRALHHRPTRPVPGVRFYTHANLGSYSPTDDSAADALHGQAMHRIDFPALVERAWADGVRLFVEHGPHAGCTKWIDEVLGTRPHLAVALDRYGRSSLLQALESVARLAAAGVPMNQAALTSRLEPPAVDRAPPPAPARRSMPMQFAAHLPPVRIADPIQTEAVETMAPAPPLPPVGEMAARAAVGEATVATTARATTQPAGVAALTAVELVTSHNARLAEMHRAFLRQQAASHDRFLRLLAQVGPPRREAARAAAPVEPAAPSVESVVITRGDNGVNGTNGVHGANGVHGTKGVLRAPAGPRFSRAQLEVLASGKISSVFGPLFAQQDGWARQVRMPEPPLLLADRVLGIEGEPGSMGRGTIWTETDVRPDAFYLHEGRMPAGILIESGQADLLLISWLGVDFLNRGERVYRLLGCDLVSHGELPRPGDTLHYEIKVDGHARQGDVRLFFFHYDCYVNGELRVTVRHGQAGFFTDEELAASAGILWSADEAQPTADARLDPPAALSTRRHFTRADLDAFVAGRTRECFGAGFERADTHTRTPAIQGGRMRLLDEVTHFDPEGGPWKRGYLRARLALQPDHWFFAGHFKGDPCMPGTLMFEGCLQAMSSYLTALGFTLDRDGWRFEPVPDENYALRCRGQALPSSKEVIYEVFVDEIVGGSQPTIYADLLGTVDGLKAFHCRRMGLRLVPAWPLDAGRLDRPRVVEPRPVAKLGDLELGYESLLACAWGRPSEAFGDLYRPFDGTRRAPRLPGPPYHYMSRVVQLDGPAGGMQLGSSCNVEYDVPPDAWYFDEHDGGTMPYAVLLEVALQPCGWLASYAGGALTSEVNLVFRNLDGRGTVRREVPRDSGTLTTSAKLKSLSRAGGLVIVGFDVVTRAGAEVVHELQTVFGFFTADAMRQQSGISASPEEQARLVEPSDVSIDLAAETTTRAPRLFDGNARLASGKLRMIDRITGLWPAGGAAGLGRIRAEKDIDASQWFFRAHFFQDPVQPGSLGLEAMLQVLKVLMLETNPTPAGDERFEAIALDRPLTWKYRGQVLPENRVVLIDLEITSTSDDERGRVAIADASLWVDGTRIYQANNLAARLVPNPSTL